MLVQKGRKMNSVYTCTSIEIGVLNPFRNNSKAFVWHLENFPNKRVTAYHHDHQECMW